MKRYFCTYFDHRYLPRAMALHASLVRHVKDFSLCALCLDDTAHRALEALALPGVDVVGLGDLESADPDLVKAKEGRSRVEYYFTLTPALSRFALDRHPDADLMTYLDADLYFFGSPEPLYEELGKGSTAIIEHRFAPGLEWRLKFGRFNVGWVSHRRDGEGLACLEGWRKDCLEWCFDRVEEDRFADQKYLDRWPEAHGGVVVLEHKGANVAPWNAARYGLRLERGVRILVDDAPLIFFHFHGLVRLASWLYDPCLRRYGIRGSRVIRRIVYSGYLRELRAMEARLERLGAGVEVPRGWRSKRSGGSGLWAKLKRVGIRGLIPEWCFVPRSYRRNAGGPASWKNHT